MNSPILRKEGKHHKFMDLEFWAEDGLIFIEDRRDGDFKVITCKEFAHRADAINEEAKREYYADDRHRLNDCVLAMHEVWKEAKTQGDVTDVKIAMKKHKERRRATIVTGIW